MIFYFTGTGNSLWIARELAKEQGERLYSIADEISGTAGCLTYELKPDEKVGFVFPIYAWAPPKMVLDFIRKLSLTGYRDQYVFGICSCGDEAGYAFRVLERELGARGIGLSAGYSVQMPNNYLITGFNVDSKEVETRKLTKAAERVSTINEAVSGRRHTFDFTKGGFAGIKTYVAAAVFNTFLRSARPFMSLGACTSCGLCQRICPTRNISLVGGRPEWKNNCTQCFACVNRCPVHAVQYGKSTFKKGRYCHPTAFRD